MVKLIWMAILGIGISVAPVSATPISLDTWYEFSFFDVDVPAMGCFPADADAPECIGSSGTPTSFAPAPPWTFTLDPNSPGALTVVDAFTHGDAFQIFDFGLPIAITLPAVDPDFVSCGDDPVPCLADPLTSRSMTLLAPGSHSLTIAPYASPYGAGAAYFDVETPTIPEPSSIILVGSALLLLALRSSKNRRALLIVIATSAALTHAASAQAQFGQIVVPADGPSSPTQSCCAPSRCREPSIPFIVTTNLPPVAIARGPMSDTGLAELNGNDSSDPDGIVSIFEWDFGDGSTGDGPFITHSYSPPILRERMSLP